MNKNKSFATNTLSPDILALKPRQVLLFKPDMVRKETAERDGTELTFKPDQKALLHRLIAHYFNQSGFSKTVKKFISEAELQKEDLVDGSISLEEIFREHLENSNHGNKILSSDEIEEINGKSKKDMGNESLADEGVGEKKKKKKQKKINVIEDEAMVSAEASKETSDEISDDHEKKHKDKKKKGKSCSKSVDDVKPEGQGEGQSSEIQNDSDREDKPKHKKKKNKKKDNESKQEPDVTKAEKVNGETENEDDKPKSKKRKSDNQISNEHEAEKASKKQKRSEVKESKEQTADDKKAEENNANGFLKTPEKQAGGEDNKNLEKSGAKSTTEKSAKMQNGSKEPKKPFQRVNVEEVVFTDERLQDNSYWAKGGAETGYGAKAQEVLGQVRGRDFRHEKTKKKRGSYRGGLIDLQTHSVKFDNSDDE